MTSPTFVLSGCITIQNDDDLSFFLQDTRHAYPDTHRHLGNRQAVGNLSTCSLDEVVIVGHGEPGVLLTANGERRGHEGQFISTRTDLRALAGPGALRLVGCQTGAGPQGAALLDHVAAMTQRTVRAPVGDVFFGKPNGAAEPGLYLQHGTDWVEASPGAPAPIVEPPTVFVSSDAATIRLRLRGSSDSVDVPLSAVDRLDYQALQPRGSVAAAWSPDRIRAAVRFIDFAHPFEPGSTAAVARGILTLRVRFGDSEPVSRTFIVYNNTLLMDVEFRQTYYRLNLDGLLSVV